MLKALLYMRKIKAKTSRRAQAGGLEKIKVILTGLCYMAGWGNRHLPYAFTLNFLYHYPCLGFTVMLPSTDTYYRETSRWLQMKDIW